MNDETARLKTPFFTSPPLIVIANKRGIKMISLERSTEVKLGPRPGKGFYCPHDLHSENTYM